jgi:hypothetical protein
MHGDSNLSRNDGVVKSQGEAPRWLDKKFDIQGAVFLAGSRLYIWYVEGLPKICNAGDRTFYDAIKGGLTIICQWVNFSTICKKSFYFTTTDLKVTNSFYPNLNSYEDYAISQLSSWLQSAVQGLSFVGGWILSVGTLQ